LNRAAFNAEQIEVFRECLANVYRGKREACDWEPFAFLVLHHP